MTDHDKLRTLAQQATPGPWHAGTAQDGDECGPLPYSYVTGEVLAEYPGDGWNDGPGLEAMFETTPEDAQYIAAVHPQAVLAILDELNATRNLLERAQRTIDAA